MSTSNYHLLGENKNSFLLGQEEEYSIPLESVVQNQRIRFQNLDIFLNRVYNYYQGKGFLCIFLSRGLNLLSLAWFICFSTFLLTSVDYYELFSTYNLNSSIGYRGISPIFVIFLVIFCTFWFWEFIKFLRETIENLEIKDFYYKELRIDGNDLQTIEWREIVQKIVKVPDFIKINQKPLTSLDIANRIMRQDNYMIAMVNKGILNLSLPIFQGKDNITKILEWSLSYSILNHVFDGRYLNGINPAFLEESNLSHLAESLRKRFRLLGFIILFLSPFIFVFLILYNFFQYGEEIRNRPSNFTMRQWTPLARWKFRELNELPHVFQKRLNSSYEFADKYVNCFPSNVLVIFARFFSFILGSILAVLIIIGLIDDQALFKIEIMENKSAFLVLSMGGTIIALLRGLIPNENAVMEPQKIMEEVVQHTHYMPKSWRGRTHTHKVLEEFTTLFQYKIVNFFMDILSVVFVPFILLFSLPNCSNNIIIFFRKYTIFQSEVGYICKFAEFPLEDVGDSFKFESTQSKEDSLKQGKMEKSFLNFKFNYPEWKPSEKGEKYIENLNEALTSSQMISETLNRSESNQRMYSNEKTFPIANENDVHKFLYRSNINVQFPTSSSKIL